MTRYGRAHEGVELSDGTGYMGTLNVFHELHCLVLVFPQMSLGRELLTTKKETNIHVHIQGRILRILQSLRLLPNAESATHK